MSLALPTKLQIVQFSLNVEVEGEATGSGVVGQKKTSCFGQVTQVVLKTSVQDVAGS